MTAGLDGKILLVTGAASGIGRATCLAAAEAGAAGLVAADRDEAGLDITRKQAVDLGCPVETIVADVIGDGASTRITDHVVARFGRIDAAVNGAGIEGATAPLHECSDEEFDQVLAVNLTALFRAVRAQLRQMYHQGNGGSIVNISSASVFGVHAAMAPYIVSKAGVLTLSRVAAKEAGPHGVRVNAVCPGLTETPMLERSFTARPSSTQDIADAIPLRRLGRPDELAAAIIWLCSDDSSFTNGAALVVDGGRTV